MKTFYAFSWLLAVAVSYSTANAGIVLDSTNMIDPPGATGDPANPSAQTILDAIKYDTDPTSGKDVKYLDAVVVDIGVELFKQDLGSSGEGVVSDSYEINDFSATGGTLSYVAGESPIVDVSEPAWFVVKDGISGFVVWDLTTFGDKGVDWDGLQDITFSNEVFPHNGNFRDISNVQIWGESTPIVPTPGPNTVPEPASVLVWGLGCCVCGAFVWRRRQLKQVAALS